MQIYFFAISLILNAFFLNIQEKKFKKERKYAKINILFIYLIYLISFSSRLGRRYIK
jgi:hypothetical protein